MNKDDQFDRDDLPEGQARFVIREDGGSTSKLAG
jgi:hypothetical protein